MANTGKRNPVGSPGSSSILKSKMQPGASLAVHILSAVDGEQSNCLRAVFNTIENPIVSHPHAVGLGGAFELLDSKWARVGMERFYMLLHTFSGLLRQGIDLLFYLFSDQNPVGH